MTRRCGWLLGFVSAVLVAPGAVRAADGFDAVPFGFALESGDSKHVGVRWAEPRKIRRVVVEFSEGGALPVPEAIRLQYWHAKWSGRPEPVAAEQGAGGVGWDAMDDWTNGQWKDADAHVEVSGRQWVYTFAPSGAREFTDIGAGVTYRKTLQIRLDSDVEFPRPVRLQAFTDAIYQPLTVRIHFGRPAHPGVQIGEVENGHLEVFNGKALAVRGVSGAEITGATPPRWNLTAADAVIEADLLMAVDPLGPRFDRTVVTVRSSNRPFSFAAPDAAEGQRILVDDLGVLVVRADDPITLKGYRETRKEFSGRTVYDRIFDEPEQTLANAWEAMPLKRPLYFVHGLPGNRHAMQQQPDGGIIVGCPRRWLNVPKSESDTPRRHWPGDLLTLGFGFPGDEHVNRRALRDGYLPVLTTWYRDGGLSYEQRTVLDTQRGGLEQVALDEPSLLLMQIRIVNTSDTQGATARLRLTSRPGGESERLAFDAGRIMGSFEDRPCVRYLSRGLDRGRLEPAGEALNWTLALAPGEAHDVFFMIPSITLETPEEIDPVTARDFTTTADRVCRYWQEVTARGCQIQTPEPWINDFWKTHLRHMLVNCFKELDSDRLHAHVGTFHYGVYPDESVMMINNLDRRGYHDEARRCYDAFLHYQGTVQMPGNFKSKAGVFYGSGGHDQGGYNKSHAWVMWGMAQHWFYTRDRVWMERAAPRLIAACDWVTRERAATMQENPDGSRPLEYGFLPAGSLEDVTDYWTWMVTNACTDWGFAALSSALADFGHAEAARLREDSREFHEDLMRGFEESRILAPVVRLRDLTWAPKYPSRLHERGRSHGWLRETLEGSIHLLITDLLDATSPQAGWILKDFEDNLYISDEYGYAIPSFDAFWFSRGGFSMQANLLGGPLPYLYRDEVKHYLRAYFNSLASAFYPDTRMCNEHSLPELGYPRGDHFKSSDEAQSNDWLAQMFVHARGGDLYLGRAIPREWLKSGPGVSIERAATPYGPVSLEITTLADGSRMRARVVRAGGAVHPKSIYLRFRHPAGKKLGAVTVNGAAHAQFDAGKEWVVLPGNATGRIEVMASY